MCDKITRDTNPVLILSVCPDCQGSPRFPIALKLLKKIKDDKMKNLGRFGF